MFISSLPAGHWNENLEKTDQGAVTFTAVVLKLERDYESPEDPVKLRLEFTGFGVGPEVLYF